MADVIATLGKIGGGDIRATRPAGWRTVLRGWQRVEEFGQIAAFLRATRAPRTTVARASCPKNSRPP